MRGTPTHGLCSASLWVVLFALLMLRLLASAVLCPLATGFCIFHAMRVDVLEDMRSCIYLEQPVDQTFQRLSSNDLEEPFLRGMSEMPLTDRARIAAVSDLPSRL